MLSMQTWLSEIRGISADMPHKGWVLASRSALLSVPITRDWHFIKKLHSGVVIPGHACHPVAVSHHTAQHDAPRSTPC